MHNRLAICVVGLLPVVSVAACALAPPSHPSPLVIPNPATGAKRAITTDDLIALRDIDTLAVSPDGARYAILVRQADVAANGYRTAWFVGSTAGGALTFVGDGGEARLRNDGGRHVGIIVGSPGRWSPDSRRIAHPKVRDGEVQLWVSDADGGGTEQVTRSAADIIDFSWSKDGRSLYFTTGTARETLLARDEADRRNGFLLEEFQFISELIYQPQPARPLEIDPAVWTAAADGSGAHAATAAERAEFELAKSQNFSWGRSQPNVRSSADLFGSTAPPIVAANGSLAWLARADAQEKGPLPFLRITASRRPDGSDAVTCKAAECRGQYFGKVWWNAPGTQVIFWRKEDTNLVENGFYAWSPESAEPRRLFRHDGDEFSECVLTGNRLICVREMVDRPDHVAAIDLDTGAIAVLADVNPEFRNIELGKVERFEWRAPPDTYKLGYPGDMFGYIIYPPDFDPKQKYPVFIAPYGAPGFRRGDVGDEHPLFVYAANGFVVISSQFPVPLGTMAVKAGALVAETYSPAHDFPHLTMLANSTFRALDAVIARGFVDERRVGIGGLSHGSFVPLYMLQKQDRFAAVSIAGPGWSQFQYYASTRTGRMLNPGHEWPEARKFWSQIDIADHVEAIEAPLLVNYPDREFFSDWRLPRRMENAGRAFEAHIYPDENHVKWQSAHRDSIYKRNLDWFRFWLQDYEDPAAEKREQYERWHQLRDLQCKNRRSLRKHCPASVEKSGP